METNAQYCLSKLGKCRYLRQLIDIRHIIFLNVHPNTKLPGTRHRAWSARRTRDVGERCLQCGEALQPRRGPRVHPQPLRRSGGETGWRCHGVAEHGGISVSNYNTFDELWPHKLDFLNFCALCTGKKVIEEVDWCVTINAIPFGFDSHSRKLIVWYFHFSHSLW